MSATSKSEITKGDVVRLKSSGPRMTVQADNGDTVDLIWFPYGAQQPSHSNGVSKELLAKVK